MDFYFLLSRIRKGPRGNIRAMTLYDFKSPLRRASEGPLAALQEDAM